MRLRGLSAEARTLADSKLVGGRQGERRLDEFVVAGRTSYSERMERVLLAAGHRVINYDRGSDADPGRRRPAQHRLDPPGVVNPALLEFIAT